MRLFIIIVMGFISNGLFAQSSNYIAQMEQAVTTFDHVESFASYKSNVAQFEQIHKIYPSEWLPLYYTALLKSKMAMLKMGEQDVLADEAIALIQEAKKIQINDELLCAESLVYTTKMAIKPFMRWVAMEHKIKAPLVAVKKINKENPRLYVLEALLQYRMPKLLGGGCDKAYPIGVIAMQKLLQQTKQARPFILPHWGQGLIADMLTKCK